jgi:uncharacterized protein (DUF1330 family)
MAHGYWVASFLSTDGYRAHMAESAKALTRFAARIVTGGVATEPAEGKATAPVMVIEFPDYAAAVACYRSPEYARAKALALGDVAILDGYLGRQPSGLSPEDMPWPLRPI